MEWRVVPPISYCTYSVRHKCAREKWQHRFLSHCLTKLSSGKEGPSAQTLSNGYLQDVHYMFIYCFIASPSLPATTDRYVKRTENLLLSVEIANILLKGSSWIFNLGILWSKNIRKSSSLAQLWTTFPVVEPMKFQKRRWQAVTIFL